MKRVIIAYFSPTHTTQKILQGIARGTKRELIELDLTTKVICDFNFRNDDLFIVGAPTYSGRIPQVAFDRLVNLKGSGGPAVAVSVYGNAKLGNALKEIEGLLGLNNFAVIAGASFIGEHSFSSETCKIAEGRPNEKDLKIASDFGEKIIKKLTRSSVYLNLRATSIPGEFPIEPRKIMGPMMSVATLKCVGCGVCIDVCPVHAIDANFKCDSAKCIKCFACVKACPYEARELVNEGLINVSKRLAMNPYKEPKIYLE